MLWMVGVVAFMTSLCMSAVVFPSIAYETVTAFVSRKAYRVVASTNINVNRMATA
jgi:hypothetical protein